MAVAISIDISTRINMLTNALMGDLTFYGLNPALSEEPRNFKSLPELST